jgi:hypothetical protein
MKDFLLLAVVTATIAPAYGDFRKSDWKLMAPLQTGDFKPPSGAFVRVALTGEALSRAQESLSDLRVVDDKGGEVPDILAVEKSTPQEMATPVAIRDRGEAPGRYQQLVCDLLTDGTLSKEIRLTVVGQDYVRRVDVEGSPDARTWVRLRTGAYIYDQFREIRAQNSRITYPECGYRYLKLMVWLDGGKPLDIPEVDLIRVTRRPAQHEAIPGRILNRSEDRLRKFTDLMVEVGLENQHLEKCLLEVPADIFRRRVSAAYRDRNRMWVDAGEGSIYRFKLGPGAEQNLAIPLTDVNARQVRLRIWNEDSPSLPVISATFQRMPRVLVFQWKAGRTYRLFVACPDANPASYDLTSVADQLDLQGLPALRMGATAPNPDFVPRGRRKPWTDRHPVVLWSGLATGVLLLIWMLRRTLVDLHADAKE